MAKTHIREKRCGRRERRLKSAAMSRNAVCDTALDWLLAARRSGPPGRLCRPGHATAEVTDGVHALALAAVRRDLFICPHVPRHSPKGLALVLAKVSSEAAAINARPTENVRIASRKDLQVR